MEARNLTKTFGATQAVTDVNFKLERHMYLQEQQEFKIFAGDPRELAELESAVRKLTRSENLRAL